MDDGRDSTSRFTFFNPASLDPRVADPASIQQSEGLHLQQLPSRFAEFSQRLAGFLRNHHSPIDRVRRLESVVASLTELHHADAQVRRGFGQVMAVALRNGDEQLRALLPPGMRIVTASLWMSSVAPPLLPDWGQAELESLRLSSSSFYASASRVANFLQDQLPPLRATKSESAKFRAVTDVRNQLIEHPKHVESVQPDYFSVCWLKGPVFRGVVVGEHRMIVEDRGFFWNRAQFMDGLDTLFSRVRIPHVRASLHRADVPELDP